MKVLIYIIKETAAAVSLNCKHSGDTDVLLVFLLVLLLAGTYSDIFRQIIFGLQYG